MKRTLTIILILAVLLSLASCGITSRGGGEISLGDEDGAAAAYSARTLSTDSELGILSSVCGADGGAYAAFDSGVYFVSYDGTLEALDLSLPDGAAVPAMCAGDDGLWLTVRRTVGDSFAYELWLVSDGEAPEVFELAVRDKLAPHSMCRSGDRLYIGMSDYINTFVLGVYDLGGKPEYELDIGSDFTVTGDGGRVYVGHRSRAEGKLTLSEADSRKLNTLASFSGGRLLSCAGDRVYLSDTTGAFEYGVGTGEVSRLFQWESVGVSSAGAKLCSDGAGNFIVFGSQGIKLVTPSGEARRQIVLALNSPPGMYSTAVLDFNSASEEYELVIRDYSGYQNPQQMLAVDIASNRCPDLIDLMSFPADILGANAMTDLTEYLKADPDINESDLLPGALSAMKTVDGRLPAIAPLFYVNSLFTVADGYENTPFTGISDGLERLGEAEYALAECILDGIGSVLYPNSTALQIVRECSAAFFAGDTTADECAGDIRSRLDIYTWERG